MPYVSAIPTSRDTLAAWALRKCGAPVLKINIDDQQLSDRIDDAIQFLQEYHFDFIKPVVLKIQITQQMNDDQRIPIPDLVTSINEVLGFQGPDVPPLNNMSTADDARLFDYEFILRTSDLYQMLNGEVYDYAIAKTYLATVANMFQSGTSFRYNKYDGFIYLDAVNKDFKLDNYLWLSANSLLNSADNTKLWGDRILRDYAAELVRLQWGENLSKFGGITLPGGVVLDGQTIIDQANAAIEKITDDFISRYSDPTDFFVG